MPRNLTPPTATPPRYHVGEKVKFMYVRIPVVGEITEDRGPIGVGGRRLYRIRYSRPDSDPSYTELPEEELEPAT
jgi:hypothetical protein